MTVQLTVLTDIMSTTIRKMPLETQSENLIRGNQPRLRPSTSENSSRIPDSVPPRPTGRNRFQPQHVAVERWCYRAQWSWHRTTETEVLGLIPGMDGIFFQISNLTQIFFLSFCVNHLGLTSHVSNDFLYNTYHSFLSLLSSSSVCKMDKVNKCSFSISALYLTDTVGSNHQ